MRRLAALGSLALCVSLGLATGACTSTEGPATPPKDGGVEAPPRAPEEPLARAAIASVQLIEDCPDRDGGWRPPPVDSGSAKADAAAPAASAERSVPAPAAAMPVAGEAAGARPFSRQATDSALPQPCTQSTMQVVFSGQGDRTSKVEIEAVRLLDPNTGKAVATLEAREPAAWADGAYQSWNETIGPRQAVKASYELSVPDWAEVEGRIGMPSSGAMFLLELDVKVGDELQTVRSGQFPREMPHVIVT